MATTTSRMPIWKNSTNQIKQSFETNIILGIDPGIANTGYACLLEQEGTLSLLEAGVFVTKKNPVPYRIKQIYDFFSTLLTKHPVGSISIEKIYFNKNVKTAMIIEEVRGALLLLSAQHSISIHQYTPLEVKKSLTLFGKASKLEVKLMAERIINSALPKSDDACDAVAVALCHSLLGKEDEPIDTLD